MNNIDYIHEIIKKLKNTEIQVWIFGGWAEELFGIISPRKHNDVDLLYPASNFEKVDKFMSIQDGIKEIIKKRFIHKRAFMYKNIMVEIILLQQKDNKYYTDFFGKVIYSWPNNVLNKKNLNNTKINIASQESLLKYRKDYKIIEKARELYFNF